MKVTLRDYQADALDKTKLLLSRGLRRILLVAPTGAGKTTIAGAMIHGVLAKGKHAQFWAHRKELIEQCSSRLDQMDVPHSVIKGQHHRYNPDLNVQVASIQTLKNRDHHHADIIIVDEAHRSTSATYIRLIKQYGPDIVVIGLTATPYRLDGQPLGWAKDPDADPDLPPNDPARKFEFYQQMVEVAEVQQLIDEGYLVMPTVFGAPAGGAKIDFSKINKSYGDYDKKQVSAAMQPAILRGDLLRNWAEKCGAATGHKPIYGADGKVVHTDCNACTALFAPSVEDSKRIVEQFKAAGVAAAHIDGTTPDTERDQILQDLRDRKLTMVSNYQILCEGWDLPHLESVIGARLTASKSLVRQMVGRLMRPHEEKRFAYLLDHAEWTANHGFVNEPQVYSLEGREKRLRKGGESQAPVKQCPECLALLPIGDKVCNACYYEFPERTLEQTDEDLVELTPKNKPIIRRAPQPERQGNFDRWCQKCKEGNYKPKWARMQYQRVYGEWPSKACGITTPRFFWDYEKEYERRLRKRAKAEAAAG